MKFLVTIQFIQIIKLDYFVLIAKVIFQRSSIAFVSSNHLAPFLLNRAVDANNSFVISEANLKNTCQRTVWILYLIFLEYKILLKKSHCDYFTSNLGSWKQQSHDKILIKLAFKERSRGVYMIVQSGFFEAQRLNPSPYMCLHVVSSTFSTTSSSV